MCSCSCAPVFQGTRSIGVPTVGSAHQRCSMVEELHCSCHAPRAGGFPVCLCLTRSFQGNPSSAARNVSPSRACNDGNFWCSSHSPHDTGYSSTGKDCLLLYMAIIHACALCCIHQTIVCIVYSRFVPHNYIDNVNRCACFWAPSALCVLCEGCQASRLQCYI